MLMKMAKYSSVEFIGYALYPSKESLIDNT